MFYLHVLNAARIADFHRSWKFFTICCLFHKEYLKWTTIWFLNENKIKKKHFCYKTKHDLSATPKSPNWARATAPIFWNGRWKFVRKFLRVKFSYANVSLSGLSVAAWDDKFQQPFQCAHRCFDTGWMRLVNLH